MKLRGRPNLFLEIRRFFRAHATAKGRRGEQDKNEEGARAEDNDYGRS